MSPSSRPWLGAALLAALIYFLVGTLFALPHTHVHAWRLAAWGASALAYATHLGYEQLGRRSTDLGAARHVSLAVAIGAFALALRLLLQHWLSPAAAFRPAWLVALVAWPVVTAVPAFLVALAAGPLLARISGTRGTPAPAG